MAKDCATGPSSWPVGKEGCHRSEPRIASRVDLPLQRATDVSGDSAICGLRRGLYLQETIGGRRHRGGARSWPKVLGVTSFLSEMLSCLWVQDPLGYLPGFQRAPKFKGEWS